MSRAFFEHVDDFRDVFNALTRHGGDAVVVAGLGRILGDLVKSELAVASHVANNGELPRAALVRFVVDAFLSVMLWWMEENPARPAVEIDGIFRRLAAGALNSVPLP
ncbi:MAG: TetR-like C-terminal domain-containing protein [Opitutaceae bacterium]